MTPQEQIAYLRDWCVSWRQSQPNREKTLAVCDLAERAVLNDDQKEAVRDIPPFLEREYPVIVAVLLRLLGDTP
jgi:hypothetical protein